MSVRNFLRRQVDASGSPARSCDKTEVETRPLSEYDNLVNFDKANFPLSDIKFRFDDLSMTNAMMNSSNNESPSNAASLHNNNDSLDQTIATPSSSQQLAAVHHKYQNVLDTLQQRRSNNNDESDNGAQQSRSSEEDDQQQQVNLSAMSQDDHDASARFAQRPAISDAKSLFFGLSQTSTPRKSTAGDELDKLIEDIGNAKLLAGENAQHQYVNFPTEESKTSQSSDKTPSGSSSTTATPSATPTRQDKLGSRKNSESSSSRSKSPKFMVPDAAATPSQAIYASTTVPLNIKGHKISGRHKPTRQSLRHSRMIVTTTNKGFQGSSARRHNSLNIKYVWFAKFVLTLKVLVGLCILVLGAWICLYANSTPIQQNPFWAGLILIASGLLGHYLLTFKRIRSTSLQAKFFWFLKANAAVIIILAVFSTTLALIYASFHYVTISSDDKHCFPENHFIHGSSCICIFNVRAENATAAIEGEIKSHTDSSGLINLDEHAANTVHFKDISCSELSTWSHILLTSMILNFAGLCLAVCFMTQFIFGCKRRRKHYSNVRNDP